LRELLKPLSQAIEPIEVFSRQFAELEKTAAKKVALKILLRPPGAISETEFLSKCSQCGECVKVCPAQCIKIDETGEKGAGRPYIDADAMPCVVCDGLLCMPACPTGALVPTLLSDINMGLAVWNEQSCLRSQKEQCTICVDQCPLGKAAIDLHEGKIRVIESGCIGCGVCQHYCPTEPRSIVVVAAGK
jgi:ferredoxin-type protein NapG